MVSFLARRIVQTLITLFIVSLISFVLSMILPGDPTLAHAADERVTRDSIERCWAVVDDVVTRGI